MLKKDYRKCTGRPHERKVKAQNMIRAALIEGEKSFSELLVETGLSRPALSSNLHELEKEGHVKKEIDSKDLRVRRYSLTAKGIDAYKRQRDIEALGSMRFFPVSVGELIQVLGAFMRDFMYVYGAAVEFAYPEDSMLPIKKEAQGILQKCITLSFYVEPSKGEKVKPLPALKEFVQSAVSVASSQDVDIERLRKVPNLSFVFQFNKDKLVEEYLKKVKATPS